MFADDLLPPGIVSVCLRKPSATSPLCLRDLCVMFYAAPLQLACHVFAHGA